MTVVATFPKLAHDWLVHELDPQLFRRAGTVKSGAGVLGTGRVLGKITTGAATSAAKAGGNTGNGALTLDVATPVLGTGIKLGVWAVRCIAAAANGGTFRVEDPDGVVRGDVAVGATFADGIKFAIADGSSDFIVGDGFDITVAVGSGKFVPIAFAATDGSQKAAAILINGVDATSADVETAVLVGSAQIVPNQLTWPDGASSPQKTAALAELALLGIVSHQR